MLKIKEQLRYKRGGTSRYCGGCDNFVRNFQCIGIGGEDLGTQPRCKKIGLKAGRMYRVHENNVCDAFCNEQHLRHLVGDKQYEEMVMRKSNEAA